MRPFDINDKNPAYAFPSILIYGPDLTVASEPLVYLDPETGEGVKHCFDDNGKVIVDDQGEVKLEHVKFPLPCFIIPINHLDKENHAKLIDTLYARDKYTKRRFYPQIESLV